MSWVKDTYEIATGGAQRASDAMQSIYKIAEVVENLQDASNVSLPNYIKKCAMLHRVYVQKDVAAEEEVLYDILVNTQNMIAAWALCALQLNTKVDGVRTARKLLDIVATESLGKGSKLVTTLEKLVEKYPGNIYGKEALASFADNKNEEDKAKKDFKDTMQTLNEKRTGNTQSTGNMKSVDIPDNVRLPSGKVLNIDFAFGTGGEDRKSVV